MHISTVNISQTRTDRANMVIANKYKVAYGLSIVVVRVGRRWLKMKLFT